ncbi:MAG: hypothetical protein ABSF44_03660 [Candidatus Bathyarchaeia archaeon]|jgi:K+-sensing histidine kinase KdpD
MLRRKGVSLIRNLWKVVKRQFTKSAKILLMGLLIEFLIFSVQTGFLSGFVSEVISLGAMVAVFAVSLRFSLKVKEKRTWMDEALGVHS